MPEFVAEVLFGGHPPPQNIKFFIRPRFFVRDIQGAGLAIEHGYSIRESQLSLNPVPQEYWVFNDDSKRRADVKNLRWQELFWRSGRFCRERFFQKDVGVCSQDFRASCRASGG